MSFQYSIPHWINLMKKNWREDIAVCPSRQSSMEATILRRHSLPIDGKTLVSVLRSYAQTIPNQEHFAPSELELYEYHQLTTGPLGLALCYVTINPVIGTVIGPSTNISILVWLTCHDPHVGMIFHSILLRHHISTLPHRICQDDGITTVWVFTSHSGYIGGTIMWHTFWSWMGGSQPTLGCMAC